mmetsp:Transcript_7576/g.10457  ORF Transcript_7576/g.10457 Transcript_7576/m.10457 type:complete len:228 (-) Transcript_7576:40-723(-)
MIRKTHSYCAFIFLFVILWFPSNVFSQCSDEFTVAKSGVEYLRLNGTDLWSCNNTNLCARITALENAIALLQQQVQSLTDVRPYVAASIWNNTAIYNSDQVVGVIFDTVQNDTTNSYNATSGNFTVPSSGKYLIHAAVAAQPMNGAKASTAQLVVQKNGVTDKRLFRLVLGPDGLNDQMPAGSAVVYANQGDRLSIKFSMATTVVTASSWRIGADGTENYLLINKID